MIRGAAVIAIVAACSRGPAPAPGPAIGNQVVTPGAVDAAPPDADRALLRERFRTGWEAFRAGDYARAADDLEAVYAEWPSAPTLYTIAQARWMTGEVDAALAALRTLLADPDLEPRDRPLFEQTMRDIKSGQPPRVR